MTVPHPIFDRTIAELYDAEPELVVPTAAMAERTRILDPYLREKWCVEIGAGTGHGTSPLLAAGHEIVATDNSAAMLETKPPSLRGSLACSEQTGDPQSYFEQSYNCRQTPR